MLSSLLHWFQNENKFSWLVDVWCNIIFWLRAEQCLCTSWASFSSGFAVSSCVLGLFTKVAVFSENALVSLLIMSLCLSSVECRFVILIVSLLPKIFGFLVSFVTTRVKSTVLYSVFISSWEASKEFFSKYFRVLNLISVWSEVIVRSCSHGFHQNFRRFFRTIYVWNLVLGIFHLNYFVVVFHRKSSHWFS